MMTAWRCMNCKQLSVAGPCSFTFSDLLNRYQWLNHYALFSGGYREDALDCMEKLVHKYGKIEEEDPISP